MSRVLLVVSVRDYEDVIRSLKSMDLDVEVAYIPDVLFRSPADLLEALPRDWAEKYDYVIVPGSYPWDLSRLGGKVVKGTEGLGLLPAALSLVGPGGLSASVSFEKAYPTLMKDLAARSLSALRGGPLIPVRPPPVRVLAEVTVSDDDTIDLVISRSLGTAADGADVVVLAPIGGARSEEIAIKALEEVRRRSAIALGFDASAAVLRKAAVHGAEVLLSVTVDEALRADLSWARGRNLVVLVPDAYGLSVVEKAIRRLQSAGVTPILDPVALPPLSPGLSGFLNRLLSLSNVSVPKMIGLSNVVELMDADTSGSSALLMSLSAELGVGSFLVEEASVKARGLVAEARAAADMVSLSLLWRKPPKDLGVSLLEGKLKVAEISLSEGVALRMSGRDDVEIFANGKKFTVSCRSYDPSLIGSMSLPEQVKLRLAVAVYRACLPWSSFTA